MKNNIVVLILVILLFAGAAYYGYSKWRSLQPPPPQSRPYAPMGVPLPVAPVPGK